MAYLIAPPCTEDPRAGEPSISYRHENKPPSHHPTIDILESRIAPAFAAVVPLGSLDGLTGFKLSGVADSDNVGISVSAAGDVNGDGFEDLLIGTRFALGETSSAGRPTWPSASAPQMWRWPPTARAQLSPTGTATS